MSLETSPCPANGRSSPALIVLATLKAIAGAAVGAAAPMARIPARPRRDGVMWPMLAMLYLWSASWPAMQQQGSMAAAQSMALHGVALAVMFCFVPAALHRLLAYVLLGSIGIHAAVALAIAAGALVAGSPQALALAIGWKLIVAALGSLHLTQAHRRPSRRR